MRRTWRLLICVAVLMGGLATYFKVRASNQRRREAAYAVATRVYAREFSPGLTRKQVEERLRSQGRHFTHNQWSGGQTFGLIRLGREEGPWYCRSIQVYVAFEFEHDPAERLPQARETDVLKGVTLVHQPEGCL